MIKFLVYKSGIHSIIEAQHIMEAEDIAIQGLENEGDAVGIKAPGGMNMFIVRKQAGAPHHTHPGYVFTNKRVVA